MIGAEGRAGVESFGANGAGGRRAVACQADGEAAAKRTASAQNAPDGTSLQQRDSTTVRHRRGISKSDAVQCTKEIV